MTTALPPIRATPSGNTGRWHFDDGIDGVKFAAGEFVGFADDQDLLDARQAFQRFADGWVEAAGGGARAGWADRAEHADDGAFDALRKVAAQAVIFEEGHNVFDGFVVTMRLHYDNHENCSFVSATSDEWLSLPAAPIAG